MENKPKSGSKKALVILIIAALILGAVYMMTRQKANDGSKAFTVEVVNQAGESVSYEGKTDQEFVHGALDELAENSDFEFDGQDQSMGFMIESINGEQAIYDKDQAYWAFYVNDAYAENGIDTQPVADGDAYKFVYEKA